MEIKDISAAAYTKRVKFLLTQGIDPKNPDDAIKTLLASGKSVETVKSYFVALKWATKDESMDIQNKYTTEITKISKALRDKSLEQKMTVREKEKYGDKYPTWESILEDVAKIKTLPEVSDSEKLLLDLYTLIPPARLDYINFKLYTSPPVDDSGNYAVIRKSNSYIRINEYKMEKSGAITTQIKNPLHKSFVAFMKSYPAVTTLWNITDCAMSRLITNLFKMLDKNYSVNTLRHAYASYKQRGDAPLLDKIADAKAMGHSLMTAATYRRI